jgi:hypothetical protein
MSSTDAKSRTKSAGLPERARRLDLFGPPPLIEGEDMAAYDELLTLISASVKPVDILEDIWVRDIVDLVWETFRLRRLKASLMTAAAYEGLEKILVPLVGWSDANSLSWDWARHNQSAVKKVDELLASTGQTMDAVMAQTLSAKLDGIERIDRMTMTAEVRRIAILREVDRHREALGDALRRAVQHVEDAEFEVVDVKQAIGRNVA